MNRIANPKNHVVVRLLGFGLLAVLVVGLLSVSTSVSAATVPYGDYSGATVDFTNVHEDSLFSPPYYGAPTVVGDSLFFSPLSFGATTAGGGVSLIDGSIISGMMASSAPIVSIDISEVGDYSLFGAGTSATSAAISTIAYLTVLEVDNAPVTPFTVAQSLTFTPPGSSNGNWNLASHAGLGVIWNGGLTLDVPAILAGAGISGGATKVQLRLQNTMAALSEPLSVAFIQKKGVIISVRVPEPSSIFLATCGGLALVVCGYRRRKSA